MFKNNFAIGIPTINRLDLLHPALLYYLMDFPEIEIHILDNGKQDIEKRISHPNIIVTETDVNYGVAKSWNTLCDDIFQNHEYALILNDDIYLGRTQWEILSLLVNPEYKSDLYVGTQDWCCFLLPKKTFEIVGRFDENFYPAYYEDNDYHYRLNLGGMKTLHIPYLNPLVHRSSKTIEKDSSLRTLFEDNKDYYIHKWGGEPTKETYSTPFNK